MLTTEELEAIGDFRFKRRIPSHSAAVRSLLYAELVFNGLGISREHAEDTVESEQAQLTHQYKPVVS